MRKNQGFTLLELAVVLVMLALLIAGVLVGRDLIRAAEIRKQAVQLSEYEKAYAAFRLKYNCLPGDCAHATDFFAGVVNGNGNDFVENNQATYYDAGPAVLWSASTEYQNFFIHLARAGYIAVPFDGSAVIGQGFPRLVLNEAAGFFASDTKSFQVANPGTGRNPDTLSALHGTNALWMVACHVTGDAVSTWDDDCGIFLPLDLSRLDVKMDDGMPLTGRFIGFGGANSQNHCLNGTFYDGQYPNKECQAAYIID